MIQLSNKIKSNGDYFSSGWICINKPANMSSFDVVRKLRRILSIKKLGHAGTLDPLATGILPIAFGNATKTIPYLVSSKKKYRFSILWGVKTLSHDLEGKIIEKSDFIPTKEDILAVISKLKGEIYQRPPTTTRAAKLNLRPPFTTVETLILLILMLQKELLRVSIQ